MAVTRSIQPRKQRKARYTAPLHVQGHYLSAPLSRELREQYRRRSLRVVTGDTVKIRAGLMDIKLLRVILFLIIKYFSHKKWTADEDRQSPHI